MTTLKTKNTWTIAKRLTVGFVIVTALILAFAITTKVSLDRVNHNVAEVVNEEVPNLQATNTLFADTLKYRIHTLHHALSLNPDEMQRLDGECARLTASIKRGLADARPPSGRDELMKNFGALEAQLQTWIKIADTIRGLSFAGKKSEAADLFRAECVPAYDVLTKQFDHYVKQTEVSAMAEGNRAMDITRNVILETYAFAALGFIFCVLIGVATTRSIGKVLRNVGDVIFQGAEMTASAATQIAGTSHNLSQASSEQAASLEETSASLEEMSSVTLRNAESAKSAKDLANQTRTAADNGAANVAGMRTAMDGIKASSQEISKIIKTIDEIAFQTNILALNAAVEAARAGEAGAGFAIVAEEVRNLAQRTAKSARETASKIEEAVLKSENGVRVSEELASSLEEILKGARKVDELVAEIAITSDEQSTGIQQLNKAVSQIDQVTQANASSAQESASAAEMLNAQARTQRDAVNKLMALLGRAKRKKEPAKSLHQIGEAISEGIAEAVEEPVAS